MNRAQFNRHTTIMDALFGATSMPDTYREFEVYYERHAPGHDWNATHPEMDGFTLTAGSREDVCSLVDDWHEDAAAVLNPFVEIAPDLRRRSPQQKEGDRG